MAPTTPWLLLLCLAAASAGGGVPRARAQPDSQGFISIDCGLPGERSYVDEASGLSYAPDAAFTDTGSNRNVSIEFVNAQPPISKRYLNLRSFPDGVRNCYTLRSLIPGLKYLVRATFFYGNYDNLNTKALFDLYIGVNFWKMVNVSDPNYAMKVEAIVLVPDDFVQVCLVNTGAGTPFISGLDLRPLKKTLYPQVSTTKGLVLTARVNLGVADDFTVVRYPSDPYDRIWSPFVNTRGYPSDPYDRIWSPFVNTRDWTYISTLKRVDNIDTDLYQAPTAVMQTAITPLDLANDVWFRDIDFTWNTEPQPNDPSPWYIVILHFSELLPNDEWAPDAVRQMNVFVNDKPWASSFRPVYLQSGVAYNNDLMRYNQYNISIKATDNSTRPPIINALEIFSVISTTNLSTDSHDGMSSNTFNRGIFLGLT